MKKETPHQENRRRTNEEIAKSNILVKREVRQLRKYLTNLTSAVKQAVAALDSEMRKPSTVERGSNVAKISNFLEMANDGAFHFGLHKPFKRDAQ